MKESLVRFQSMESDYFKKQVIYIVNLSVNLRVAEMVRPNRRIFDFLALCKFFWLLLPEKDTLS